MQEHTCSMTLATANVPLFKQVLLQPRTPTALHPAAIISRHQSPEPHYPARRLNPNPAPANPSIWDYWEFEPFFPTAWHFIRDAWCRIAALG